MLQNHIKQGTQLHYCQIPCLKHFKEFQLNCQNKKNLDKTIRNDLYKNSKQPWKCFQKSLFPVQNRKNERHLGTKFHLNETILSFWTSLAQTYYFRYKITKVSIAIEFRIFIIVYNLSRNIWNKVKKSIKIGQEEKTLITDST